MTSRKSSLSLAKPIEMPNDCREVNIDKDSHKIDILFIPSSDHVTANGNDEISENDIQLRHTNDNDEYIQTVL